MDRNLTPSTAEQTFPYTVVYADKTGTPRLKPVRDLESALVLARNLSGGEVLDSETFRVVWPTGDGC